MFKTKNKRKGLFLSVNNVVDFVFCVAHSVIYCSTQIVWPKEREQEQS